MRPERSQGGARRSLLLGAALALLPLLLSDCATHPPPAQALPPARSWAQRQVLLRSAAGHFTLEGRIAASHGDQGSSAGLRWQQQGEQGQMSLSGPLGFGGARISLSAESISIRTNDGRELSGDAALGELSRLLGFDPPLQSLRFWVVGLPDPAGSAPAPVLDAQQRLSRLTQDGWNIVYDAYMSAQREWLPRRLTLTRANLRLRLVIDDWQL